GEVRDGRDQQLGLRRKVVEQGASRDLGAALDLERRGTCESDLDQRLDRGIEQRAPGLVAALLLGSRNTNSLGHSPAVYRPTNSQSRLFVDFDRCVMYAKGYMQAIQVPGYGRAYVDGDSVD